MAYATKTEVSVEKTEAEIRALLRRYKATSFGMFNDQHGAAIGFSMNGRHIRFQLPLPSVTDQQFRLDGRRHERSPAAIEAAWEQACRSRWRGLLLCIKAKMESVDSKIETFDDAFLAHIQMPDGRLVSEVALPQITAAYKGGGGQLLLQGPQS